jgi:signal transduction histidine kinase
MYLLSVQFGIQLPDLTLAVGRVVTGGVQGATTFPLVILAASLIATYRAQRTRLLNDQVSWESRRLHEAREWEDIRGEVITPISGELNTLGHDLDEKLISIDEATKAVRARAHVLWGDSQPAPMAPRIHLRAALRASLRERPFATWLILALWLPTALGTTFASGDLPRAPLGALVSGALLATTFELGNAIVRRKPSAVWVTLLAGLVLAIAVTSPALSPIGGLPESGHGAFSIVNGVWLTALVLVSALVMAAVHSSEEVLREINATVDAVQIDTLAREHERRRVIQDVAATLHGTLQGRLTALRDHNGGGDAVRETLALLQAPTPALTATTVNAVVAQVVDPWSALMTVTVECADEMVSPAVALALSESLEEALTNAFRHGHARSAHCTIQVIDNCVVLEVTDTGQPTHGPPGLGSRILDRCGSWERSNLASGTKITMRIPTTAGSS